MRRTAAISMFCLLALTLVSLCPVTYAQSQPGEWTWVSGSSTVPPASGTTCSLSSWGTLGVADPSNNPGTRYYAATWTDKNGNFWLFGGYGCGSDQSGLLSDLWEFTPSSGEWTWVSGPTTIVSGVYGTQGVPDAANVPGSRNSAVTWTDSSGNLWLFGGYGLDSVFNGGPLNDLWEYSPTANAWTWVSGSSTVPDISFFNGQPAVYGTQGVAAANNNPGGRSDAVAWTDSSGNFWLFGGVGGAGSVPTSTFLGGYSLYFNDLWMFNPTTSQWTWMSGNSLVYSSGNTACTTIGTGNGWTSGYCVNPGVYGTQSVAAATNVPGGRQDASGWIDSSGKLWLFGGTSGPNNDALSYTGPGGDYNDLWNYNPHTNRWTWVSGSNTFVSSSTPIPGVYGSQGVAAPSNVPGARDSANAWIDSGGNFWLFGGMGYDSSGGNYLGYLNDFWKFTPSSTGSTGEWTWVGGSSTFTQFGNNNNGNAPAYGTLGVYGTQGQAAAINVPGGRYGALNWADNSGNFWLFGGWADSSDVYLYPGCTSNCTFEGMGVMNDLWEFQLPVTTVATPTFSPAGGTYTSVQDVTISDTTTGATIYYTTDGTTPTTSSTAYSNAITVSSSETINAIAVLSGYTNSAIASAAYTIDLSTAATPTLSIAGGTYTSAQDVTISDTTTGATIYYTTDGSTPTTSSYTGSGVSPLMLTVSSSETLKAIAVAPNYNNSALVSATYNLVVATPTFSPVAGAYTSAQSVTISDTTPNATIYYTTNGTTPTTSSAVYNGTAIAVSSTETIEAIAMASGFSNSHVAVATYNLSVATPTFSPAAGTYTSPQSVTISDTTPNATIYYTTDNTTPTTASTKYTQPISVGSVGVNAAYTLQAIAVASGYTNSPVAIASYSINSNLPLAATPVISLPTGTYTSAQTVTISDTTTGAAIYYTTNGNMPTASSTLYTGPITVSSSETINAIAVASGYTNSNVATAAYVIKSSAATPTFSPAAGTYASTQTVTISDTTTGAKIYYTTDGSTPTASSTAYSGAITVSSSETINAIAVASGYSNSAVASATYTISLPTQTTPVISSISPSSTTMGAAAFTLTVNGTGFTSASTVQIGSTALSTTYVSATQLTAQVTAASVASSGQYAITVATTGESTSNSMDLFVDSSNSTTYPPTFTTTTQTVTAGSPASYPVTFKSSVTASALENGICTNLPTGASCSYSASTSGNSGTLTITTSATTPKGTYTITAQFAETVTTTTAAIMKTTTISTAGVVLPVLLLPLWGMKRKMKTKARGAWLAMFMGLVLLASTAFWTGCGGGGKSSTPTTATAYSSATVTLTVQ